MLAVEKHNPERDIRICLDPKYLNTNIIIPKYYIPSTEEIISRLSGKKIYTVLDLSSGFWHLELDEKSSYLTTFQTPFGRFQYLRLCFGLSSGPELFMNKMVEIFGDISGCCPYFDDLIIAASSETEHDAILQKVFQRAQAFNIRFNKSKLQYKKPEVKFLGMIVCENGIKIDPARCEAIVNMPVPVDKKGVLRFLGLIKYLNPFLKNVAGKTENLRQLTRPKVEFHWQEPHKKEFQALQHKIATAPVLRFFNDKKPITIQADSSQSGLGACLLQEGSPVAYASRALTPVERRYSQIEKETLAIVFAAKKFHCYIYGRPVTVESDHKPLQSIFLKPIDATTARLQRFRLQLLKYNLTIQYTPGAKMFIADALLQAFLPDTEENDPHEEYTVHANTTLAITPAKREEFVEATKADPVLAQLLTYIPNCWPTNKKDLPTELAKYHALAPLLSIEDGLIFFEQRLLVPQLLQQSMLKLLHEGHLNVHKVKQLARRSLFWFNMSSDIEDYISSCETCNLWKHNQPKEPLQLFPIPTRPWERLSMDIFTHSSKDYLAIYDYYSCWIEVLSLRSKLVAEIIGLLKTVFSHFGIPLSVVSDNNPFNSNEYVQFAADWGFTPIFTSPRYSQANGHGEKGVSIAKSLLQKNNDLQLALLQYRNAPIPSLKYSPSQLLLGRILQTKIVTPADLLQPAVPDSNALLAARQDQRATQEYYYNRQAKPLPPLAVGDSVHFKKTLSDKQWIPGTIKEAKDNRQYLVESKNDGHYLQTDLLIDETYWNDESPAGEVEQLLHDFPQNQELIRNIGTDYYQIIYPAQLRRHEKMGISTRETVPIKMGKHYHHTSLLIKAFSHKFRLDLELNTQLLAPNLMQKHYLPHGAEQVSKQEIEHCYYHGTVKDIPGATAAFHTCNGISGVIHIGNETFVIHPFYGGDLARHPHVIFESHGKMNYGCATNEADSDVRPTGGHSRSKPKRTNNQFLEFSRAKRDVGQITKYVEVALIVDRAMFERRNGSTRSIVIQDALQIANIVDLYYRSINTRISVVYIETWQGANQIPIERDIEVNKVLSNFADYVARELFNVVRDTVHLISGERYFENQAGISTMRTICTRRAMAINVDVSVYEAHVTAATMAHMIGHNVGMQHDDGRKECACRDWHGCIMQQKIVGQDNIQPYRFSECSFRSYIDTIRDDTDKCLLNKPNEVTRTNKCGNKIVEENEDCDCGSSDDCEKTDPCCDHMTCKLRKEFECSATQECCSPSCKFLSRGTPCREATNECDLPESCTGTDGNCPANIFRKNGHPCSRDQAICFNGVCPTHTSQCEFMWGRGGRMADKKCYEQFNSNGSLNGHCGKDERGKLTQCQPKNVLCGSLQCINGTHQPTVPAHEYARTIISIKGHEYECKSTRGRNNPMEGLVLDGTFCSKDMICVNQTCTNMLPYLDKGKCPTDSKNIECSDHGVCSNLNMCVCNKGWTGTDCSIEEPLPTTTPTPITESTVANETESKSFLNMTGGHETLYENTHSTNTANLVGVLMAACGGVFTVFTTVALCYRSVVVHKSFSHCLIRRTTMPKIKYDSPYESKRKKKSDALPTEDEDEIVEIPGDKIPTYPGTPSCSHRPGSSTSSDSHRVFYRPASQAGSTSAPPVMTTLNQEFGVQQFCKSDSRSCLDEQLPHHLHHHHPLHHHPQLHHLHHQADDDEEEDEESGPIRIRNLEDLIRQLEHHSRRHINTVGLEDGRFTDTAEADRQYRIEIPAGSEEPRFVFGKFRHPSRTLTPSSYHMQDEERRYPSSDHSVMRNGQPMDIQVDIHESERNGYVDHHRPLGRSASEDLMPTMQTPHLSRYGSPAPPVLFHSEPERPSYPGDNEFRRISSTSLHRNVSVEECSSRDTIESSGNENSALLRSSVKYPEYKH